ncbi:MAG TPA: asparagine synthase-related protein, partial [Rhizomicrobium sp.]|nr:asparagine synthase-related protein [Rhizomicrobium sp.]
REFVNRTKQGFGIPLTKWLSGPLNAQMTHVLSDRRLMEPFDPAEIARVAHEFRTGRTHHTSRLWALFMYGLWRDSEGHAPHFDTAPGRHADVRVESVAP